MTTKTIDWLNSNRFRAYPFVNDSGLIVSGERIPDCVILDCLVVDTRHDIDDPAFRFTKFSVSEDSTVVSFSYSGESFSHTLTGGSASGDASFVKVVGKSDSSDYLHISIVMSSHAYIKEHVGTGEWVFSGTVLPTKVMSVTASGVSGISTNGSIGVPGFTSGTAAGDVHLVDGYRTQPIVQNGKVVVKVGNNYGYDPCNYDDGSSDVTTNCSDLMLFFCGQNAINGGNVILKGGPGVSVTGGRSYTAKKDIIDTYGDVGIAAGESVPCIEVSATSEVLKIYTPSQST